MANYKRRKPRRWVRCVLCSSGRAGNCPGPKARKRENQKTRKAVRLECLSA